MSPRTRIKIADVRNEYITDDCVEESPDNVDGRGGESLAGWFRKGALKGASQGAGDEMRYGVGEKDARKEIGDERKPVHAAMLLRRPGTKLFTDLSLFVFVFLDSLAGLH